MKIMKLPAALTLLICCMLAGCGGKDSGSSSPASVDRVESRKSVGGAPSDYAQTVQTLYVAYFGRPADPGGQANFENALLAAGAPSDLQGLNNAYATNSSVKALIDSFGTSKESQALYGTGTSTAFVKAIYQNFLNRSPAASGLQFWSGAISSGNLSQGLAALAIAAGAYGNSSAQGQLDAQLISNRLAVAQYFTDQVSAQNVLPAYAGAAAAWNARAMLTQVTAVTNTTAFETNVSEAIVLLNEEYSVTSLANSWRAAQGIPGTLASNFSLFQAAYNHAYYESVNGTDSHSETADLPGYTALDPGTRAELTGYPDYDVQEELGYAGISGGNLTGQGALAFNSLLATVYHRSGLMYQYETDIGVALNAGGGGSYSILDIEFGYQNSAVTPINIGTAINYIPFPTTVTGSYIGTYPLAGQTGVALHAINEIPSPFPAYSSADFVAKTGYPISIVAPTNSILNVTTFTVSQAGNSAPLGATLLTGSDPNFGGNMNTAFLVANQAFQANTVYNVTFVGTSNGVAINKTWSFTTGSGS